MATTWVPDTESATRTDWMGSARCREHDPDVFFVRGAAQSRRAVRICTRCPVREQCLGYAVEQGIEFGIWGGMTERQRRRVLRTYAS